MRLNSECLNDSGYFSPFIEHFTCIIKVLFTLLYIQALVALSVKGSTDDRTTWMNSGALKKVCDLTMICGWTAKTAVLPLIQTEATLF